MAKKRPVSRLQTSPSLLWPQIRRKRSKRITDVFDLCKYFWAWGSIARERESHPTEYASAARTEKIDSHARIWQ